MRAFLCLGVLACLIAADQAFARAATRSAPLPLTIVETAGGARRDALTTVALPLPPGALRTTNDEPAQFDGAAARALERWPDGSVRWALADFRVTLPARGRITRDLRLDRSARARGATLRIDHDGPSLRVRPAPNLTVTIPASGPLLAVLATAGGASVNLPWPTVRTAPAGDPLPPLETRTVEIEASTPLRASILVRTRGAQGLRYETRFQFTTGDPWIRLRHTVTNMGESAYLPLADLALAIPWRAVSGGLAVDGTVHDDTFAPPDRGHVLLQPDPTTALLDGAPAGRHGDGVAQVRGGGKAWTVVVPWFWQEYPKRLGVSTHGLDVGFVAAGDQPLAFGVGAAKTWDVWIGTHPAATAPALTAAAAAVTPPTATIAASSVVTSGALAYAITPDTPGAAPFLAALASAIEQYRARALAERWDDGPPGSCKSRTSLVPRVGFYGTFNWGDWNFPGFHDETKGCDAWGNLEYDLPLVLGLTYLATGDPELWPLFDATAVHYRDVDIIHHWPNHVDRVGLNHPHKVRHFAMDAPNTVDLGHVWLDGLLLHYRLTGDARSLRAVRRMADALAALTERAHNPRQFGWPMLALSSAFEATGEARYRRAAVALTARAAAKFPPDPNAEWKTGILAEGMVAVHRTTGDQVAADWLARYGPRLLEPAPKPRDPRLVAPAGYLAVMLHEPRLAALARDTAAALAPGNWGKPLASIGRVGFALLGPLAHDPAVLTPAPDAPPPGSAPAPTRSSPRP